MTKKYVKPHGDYAAQVLGLAIPAGGGWFDLSDFELACLQYDSAFELLDTAPTPAVAPAVAIAATVPIADGPIANVPIADGPNAELSEADALAKAQTLTLAAAEAVAEAGGAPRKK